MQGVIASQTEAYCCRNSRLTKKRGYGSQPLQCGSGSGATQELEELGPATGERKEAGGRRERTPARGRGAAAAGIRGAAAGARRREAAKEASHGRGQAPRAAARDSGPAGRIWACGPPVGTAAAGTGGGAGFAGDGGRTSKPSKTRTSPRVGNNCRVFPASVSFPS